ncbi:MAG: hypothetical protein A2005_11215 [Desulfuromonadales bacterium GWC2_61_20]|nr:MAG: hypothetical protein A2005_11215 [Desulfuromonadales bacterium GWC2_61_20]HAD05151.1 DUF3373 domain-containing protein [Desulfuromonas sp.]HBT83304.1 DUF3373 domain-containing protein [Desulfuromonas sp.]
MRRLFIMLAAILIAIPTGGFAADDLQLQIQELQKQIDEMATRVDSAEKKTATDRINWYGDFRNKADTLHYQDVTFNPGIQVNMTDFFMKVGGGALGSFAAFNPATPAAGLDPAINPTALDNMFNNLYLSNPNLYANLNAAMGGFDPTNPATFPGVMPFPLGTKSTYDINNDILYTTRLRLGMKAKVADNVNFSGRLLMYKNWGDSTGSKVFDSWNSYTMDGTDGGNTTGDWVRVERAYFDWNEIGGSNFYLSIGRRPSAYGPPSQLREDELRGGTPTGHLVHFNFDGITAGYKLSELTGIEGQTVRFCYGQGYESELGNGELFNEISTKDTHLGGINFDVVNTGTHFVQMTAFRAMDVNDGFKGVIAFPSQYAEIFAPTMNKDLQKFPNFNFVTRVQPSTVIGDINLAAIGYVLETEGGFNAFVSGAMTQAEPNGKAGMFGGLLSDAVFEAKLSQDGTEVIMAPVRATSDETQEGYSVYAGVKFPAPSGSVGLEYNYGSKYWIPFTQAQDDMINSKLATRGHAGEAYYIVNINPNMFLKLGGIYYDYEYTGSGSPVGTPLKVKDVQAGTAYSMLPVVDTAWDAYASITVKF